MENQKLFDKIRESLTDESLPLEWDKTGAWERIEKRQSRRRRGVAGVWWWAAAAVTLLLGYWWSLRVEVSLPVNSKMVQETKKPLPVFNQHIAAKKSNRQVSKSQLMRMVLAQKAKSTIEPLVISNLEEKAIVELKIADSQVFEQKYERILINDSVPKPVILSKSETLATISNADTPRAKERVLIIDIDLPEAPAPATDKVVKTNFLERFSRQSKRLRTERKFDLRALDSRPGKGVWSALAHSVVVPAK